LAAGPVSIELLDLVDEDRLVDVVRPDCATLQDRA
jgi:hypothetical protein